MLTDHMNHVYCTNSNVQVFLRIGCAVFMYQTVHQETMCTSGPYMPLHGSS